MEFLKHLFEKKSRKKEAELAGRLNTAIENDDTEELKRLFLDGADPYTKMFSGGNCLEAAIFLRCGIETVRTIVEAGVDPNKCFLGFCQRPNAAEMARENRCDEAVVQYLTDIKNLPNLRMLRCKKEGIRKNGGRHNSHNNG